jgi:hypothetical protein
VRDTEEVEPRTEEAEPRTEEACTGVTISSESPKVGPLQYAPRYNVQASVSKTDYDEVAGVGSWEE